MPIIQSIRKINPLDLNKNVKIGVAFPLNETNMFNGTSTIKEQIKTNLLNLLLTHPGERINLPNYGIGIKNLLFEQEIDESSLQIRIQEQINLYIPRIQLQNTMVETSEDRHTLLISLTYVYTLDNSLDTIQINFN